MTTKLGIWTVYDHPRDYPDTYVARLHVVEAGGSRPTDEIIRSTDLEALRAEMLRRGLFVPRANRAMMSKSLKVGFD